MQQSTNANKKRFTESYNKALLVYYCLYITDTLAGFLFDLDPSNVCRDIQNIKGLIRQCVPFP
ncbi:MAG: transposase family protein [Thermoproteota archaeon]|nr:transposase family protein [Thermoproteota archaeon]